MRHRDGARLRAGRLGLLVATVPLIPVSPAQSAGVPPAFLRALEELRVWTRSYPGQLAPAIGSVQPFHLPYGHRDVTAALCAYGDLVCTEAAMQPTRAAHRNFRPAVVTVG